MISPVCKIARSLVSAILVLACGWSFIDNIAMHSADEGVYYSVVRTDEQRYQKVIDTDLSLKEARLLARSQYSSAEQTPSAPGEFERYVCENDPHNESYVSIFRYPPRSLGPGRKASDS